MKITDTGLSVSTDAEANDILLAKQISEALNKHYPNHLWAIHVNSDQGVAVIKNFSVSHLWGYILKLKDIKDDPTHKQAIRAGGEILERANMARRKWDIGQKAERVDGITKETHQPFQSDGEIIIV